MEAFAVLANVVLEVQVSGKRKQQPPEHVEQFATKARCCCNGVQFNSPKGTHHFLRDSSYLVIRMEEGGQFLGCPLCRLFRALTASTTCCM